MATGNTIWLAGDCEHPEFAAAVNWLHSHCQCVGRETSSSAIVVFQSRPGSISVREVESLHRRAPLARLLLLCGVWCDVEQRGQPISGVTRIRWHQWPERLPGELDRLNRIPRTASDGDRLEESLRGLAPGIFSPGNILICTADRTSYEVLADACHVLGLNPTWNVPGPAARAPAPIDLLLIDGWRNDQPPMPASDTSARVLLLDFPRPDDQQRAAELGFSAVIAQPLLLPDLVAVLRRCGVVPSAAPARVAWRA